MGEWADMLFPEPAQPMVPLSDMLAIRDERDRLRAGIRRIVDDRWAGNFDALIPKMLELLEEE